MALSIDNILTQEQIENLFSDDSNASQETEEHTDEKENNKESTTEVDVQNLFSDEPESVGSGKDNKEKEDTTSEKSGTSPTVFYSSLAAALKDDGIFPDLNPEEISDADKFAEMFEKQVQSRLDEKIKRFDDAVNAGVEPTEAARYERYLNYLNSITPEVLSGENEQGEQLRKQIIMQDLINKGYTRDEANEEVTDIFANGTDVKRAERALKSNIGFFNRKYDAIVEEAKEEEQREIQKRNEQAEKLKKDMLSNSKAFGDLEVSQANRQKAFDAISRPVYRDPETGQMFTAIQKYEKEHSNEFMKNLGLLFVLTDNFTNLNNLVNAKVNKESKRAIRELENTLNNTRRTQEGNLKFVSGVEEDPESFFKGYTLNI